MREPKEEKKSISSKADIKEQLSREIGITKPKVDENENKYE